MISDNAAAASSQVDRLRSELALQQSHACRSPRSMYAYRNVQMFGLGAQLLFYRNSFVEAVVQSRCFDASTIHAASQYVGQQFCANRSLGCHLRKLHDSAAAAKAAVVEASIGHARFSRCPEFSLRTLADTVGRGYRSRDWLLAQAMAFLLEPTPRLSQFLADDVLQHLGGGRWPADGLVIGLHIRRGDKVAGHDRWGHGNAHSQLQYVRAVRHMSLRRSISTVFFETDDPLMRQSVPRALRASGLIVLTMPAHVFAKVNHASNVAHELAAIDQSTAKNDEAMAMLAALHLFGRCTAFVGTLSSNLGRVVYDLMLSRVDGPSASRPDFHDMDNDMPFACPMLWQFPYGSLVQFNPTPSTALHRTINTSFGARPSRGIGRPVLQIPHRRGLSASPA